MRILLPLRLGPAGDDAPGRLVLSPMKDRAVPVLPACSPYRPAGTAVVGCGGGHRTARAVGTMAHLGPWKRGCRLVLPAVAASPGEGEVRLAEPRRILSDAGYPPWEEKVVPGPKADAVPAPCRAERADVVVLGGFGEHRRGDLVGRSVTGRLLAEARTHLFPRT